MFSWGLLEISRNQVSSENRLLFLYTINPTLRSTAALELKLLRAPRKKKIFVKYTTFASVRFWQLLAFPLMRENFALKKVSFSSMLVMPSLCMFTSTTRGWDFIILGTNFWHRILSKSVVMHRLTLNSCQWSLLKPLLSYDGLNRIFFSAPVHKVCLHLLKLQNFCYTDLCLLLYAFQWPQAFST